MYAPNHGRLAMRGAFKLWRVDFAREIRSNGPPPCMDLPHHGGTCPMGLSHDVEEFAGSNTIVTNLKESITNQLIGAASPLDLGVTRIAFGTSSAATTAGMTQLAAEYGRTSPIDKLKISASQMRLTWFLNASTGNAPSDLQEHGILAGGATDALGDGGLIARFLKTFAKNMNNTMTGQYDLSQE